LVAEAKSGEALAQFRPVSKAFYKVVPTFVGTCVRLDQPIRMPALYRVQHPLSGGIAG